MASEIWLFFPSSNVIIIYFYNIQLFKKIRTSIIVNNLFESLYYILLMLFLHIVLLRLTRLWMTKLL